MTNQELNKQNKLLEISEYKGEKTMSKEIREEEATDNTELLRLRAGYVQHTSPHVNPPSQEGELTNFLIHCQKQAMSEATVRTKYKILRVIKRNNI